MGDSVVWAATTDDRIEEQQRLAEKPKAATRKLYDLTPPETTMGAPSKE